MESECLVFEGILSSNETVEVNSLSIIKNSLKIEISYSDLAPIIRDNFSGEGYIQVKEKVNNILLKFNLLFKELSRGLFSFYGFAYTDNRESIGNDIFDIFDEVGNVCILLYQDEGRIIFANEAFYKTLGYDKGALKNKHVCELVGGNYRDICYHHASERLKGVKFSTAYHGIKVISKTGEERTFTVYGSTVFYNSRPAGIMFGVDITHESNLEKLYIALKDINQTIIKVDNESDLFSKICDVLVDLGFAAAVVASVGTDKSVRVEHFSGEGEDFFRNVFATVNGSHAHGRGTAGKAFRDNRIVINSDTENNEDVAYWRDELLNLGFYSSCSVPISIDGEVKNILLIFSKRKNAFINEYAELLNELKSNIEFALKKIKHERNFRLVSRVLDDIEECVVITNSDCKIEYVNDAFVKIFNVDLDNVIGKTPLFFTPDENTDCKNTPIYDELIRNGSLEFEYKFVVSGNKIKIFRVSLGVIYKDNRISHFVGLLRDITAHKKSQTDLAQLNKLYLTLYHINEAFVNLENENDILKEACKILVEDLGASTSFIMVNVAGSWDLTKAAFVDDSMEELVKKIRDGVRKVKDGKYPFIKAYYTNSIKIVPDLEKSDRAGKFRPLMKKYGLKSCFAIPLKSSSYVFGVLVAVFGRKIDISKKFYRLLWQIKYDIDTSISNLRERRWNKIISLALEAGFSYVIVMDEFFRVIYMNEAALKFHGYRYDEVIGKKHSIFSSNQHDREFLRRMSKALRSGKVFSDLFIYRTKDGRLVEGYTTIIPYKEGGKIKYYIAVGKDITKERELQNKLIFLSSHDMLTGLPHKDEFLKKVDFVLKKSGKNLAAFAIIDIHNCSYINQVYGYKVGDDIIKETAKRLNSLISPGDIVGRLSGDKFVMFISSVESEEDVLVTLMNVMRNLNRRIEFDKFSLSVSYHIGVSFYPVDGEKADDLIAKAELALMSAKSEGENEIGFFKKKTQEKIVKVVQLKDRLREAFEKDELVLFYQPYYSVESGEVAGAEALLRWIHNDRIISPAEFIEVLEESDLIFNVEERIIQRAAETISLLKKKVPISVNISPKSFRRDLFVSLIEQALDEYKISGEFLTIEVIERVFINNVEYTKNIMSQLKNMGIRIAVDDFGTGFSSLTYIRELPLDILKIDITFIKGMMKNEKDLSLVKLIVGIAKEFGIKTVAEGIETEEQLKLLKDMGCDYAQGYLFSKPLDKDNFINLLNN